MTGVLFKAIKPSKLKIDAIRLELLNAMRAAGTDMKRDFEKTTATWEHKPQFKTVIALGKAGPEMAVLTNDKVWNYVDQGTRPHDIWAGAYTGKSNKTVLAFPSIWSPKTKPGVIGSTAGRRGKTDTFRPYVEHPGTEARGFTAKIAETRKTWFKKQMQLAMARGAQKTGFAMK